MTTLIALPPIVVSSIDHDRLSALAAFMEDREPGAETLQAELARAEVIAGEGAAEAAGMSNCVDFEYDGSVYRDFMLALPQEADFANGRLSIVSHVGAMLLGLSAGQTIRWAEPGGREHQLTVLAVRPRA